MKRYPAYKDSGVEWIGEIPKSWEILKTKHISHFSNGYAYKSSEWAENGLPVIRMSNISEIGKLRITEDNIKFISIESGEKTKPFLIRKGDVLIAMTDMSFKMGILGKTIIFDQDGEYYLNQRVGRIRVDKNKIKLRFFHYTSNSDALRHQIKSDVYPNVQYNASMEAIRNCYLPYPSITEQQRIQNYLDHKTHLIDTLIEKKQKQIELLQEQRAAIINHAVTKGLNPNAKMKDSGIEWLSEVPEHWKVPALKYVCSMIKDGTHLPPPRVDNGIPLLSVRNIVNGKFVNLPDDSMISSDDFSTLSKTFQVFENDVLLAIVGATIGKVAIVGKMPPFTIQRSLAVIRPIEEKLHYKFLAFYLKSSKFQSLLWENVGFSAQPGIYLGALSNFRCVLPSYEEQVEIAAFLDEQELKIETIINANKTVIEKLKEYRTTLISDVVTGKIDVRDEAIPA